ncbi:AGAP005869-PA-like protein [Anopheles sinensis]|uniref:AGAP005869-PA-like protein n=1 Tax=Anopheles sinensis TaxID=74873 RepID=A0A084WRT4_ANOSI|nr:AGAP005869-PA-like protein [Anopheles sinensis]
MFVKHMKVSSVLLAAVRIVLGLEVLALALSTHAHAELLADGTAQDQTVPLTALPTAAGATKFKDKSQKLPPPEDAKTDDNAGKSVVVNWKLACEQLCSAGLGGPSCGASWLRSTTTGSSTLVVDKDTLDGLCPSLCANGLGVSKCNCKSFKPKIQFNQNLVCQAFCSAMRIQLNGCSRCDGTVEGGESFMQAVETTTPNWDELCSVFCKMGDGGTLCNCDLPPFF